MNPCIPWRRYVVQKIKCYPSHREPLFWGPCPYCDGFCVCNRLRLQLRTYISSIQLMTKNWWLLVVVLISPLNSIMMHRKQLILTLMPTYFYHSLPCLTPLFFHSIFVQNLKTKREENLKGFKEVTVVQCYPTGRNATRELFIFTIYYIVRKRIYYCKKFYHDCFEANFESLLNTPWCFCCCPSADCLLCLFFASFWLSMVTS